MEFLAGQVVLRLLAKVGSMGMSDWVIRSKKEPQWARPNVCAPESATTSVASKFRGAKASRSWPVLKNGGGRLLVPFTLKVRPSFLPSGTSNLGPPDYSIQKVTKFSE